MPEDGIETRNNTNDDTHHPGTYTAAWKNMNELVSHEETCTNKKGGDIVWKVVYFHSVVQDDFKEIREKEETYFNNWNLPLKEEELFDDFNDCDKSFLVV